MTSVTEKTHEFKVEVPKEFRLGFDKNGTVTSLEAPEMKFDKYREIHFEYWETFGNASKSISIETYLTNGELIELCSELMGVTR